MGEKKRRLMETAGKCEADQRFMRMDELLRGVGCEGGRPTPEHYLKIFGVQLLSCPHQDDPACDFGILQPPLAMLRLCMRCLAEMFVAIVRLNQRLGFLEPHMLPRAVRELSKALSMTKVVETVSEMVKEDRDRQEQRAVVRASVRRWGRR